MAFAGGWICRSCWSSNRGSDTRCYRCKTERLAEDATVTTSRTARTVEEARREMRQARVPALVSLWPSAIFAWYARASYVFAILTGILTVLAVMSPVTPRDRIPYWTAVPVIFVVAGSAFRWASRGMRTSNPWAFVVGLAVSVLAAWASLTALGTAPSSATDAPVTRYITIAIWGLSSLFAIIGLLYSLTSADEVPPPSAKAESDAP
jgi:hypothetical protein